MLAGMPRSKYVHVYLQEIVEKLMDECNVGNVGISKKVGNAETIGTDLIDRDVETDRIDFSETVRNAETVRTVFTESEDEDANYVASESEHSGSAFEDNDIVDDNDVEEDDEGLVGSVLEIFPNGEHRTCVRHLYSNFKSKPENQGKALKDCLWKAARATYMKEWTDAMNEMKAMSEPSFNWLQPKDPRQWSKSHFSSRCKSDILLNNLSESFNKGKANTHHDGDD
ncbi:hypothetical protein V6N13_147738 [Hibiscus sabdariffa]